MRPGETEIEMVRRHVRDGAQAVARQREMIEHLREEGLPSDEAQRLLLQFEDLQRQHEQHLQRLES